MTETIAVSVYRLIKSYETGGNITPALQGVSLDIPAGRLFMLVGPSGCGKTTLISIIAGTLRYDEGSCSVFGSELNSLKDNELNMFRRKTIGFVFQAFNLMPTLTATENVSVPLLLNGVGWNEAQARATEYLQHVGLSGKERSMPSQLSGGQQQRVAIARALVHRPKLIVCDEPTSALDHKNGEEIMTLFRAEAQKNGCTLIIVTHDSRIFSYADHIAEMDDGLVKRVSHSYQEFQQTTQGHL